MGSYVNGSEIEVGEFIVTATYTQHHETTLDLTINGEVVHTTDEHPFLVMDDNQYRWVEAQHLNIGDKVVASDGSFGVVEAITVIEEAQTMYNLTVALAHTFVVGDGQWVVHNQNFDPIPINLEFFDAIGIDVREDALGVRYLRNSSVMGRNGNIYYIIDQLRGNVRSSGTQIVEGLKTVARSLGGTNRMVVHSPSVINPRLVRILTDPRYAQRVGMELVVAQTYDVSNQLLPYFQSQSDDFLNAYPEYRVAIEAGKIESANVIFRCNL